jgi:hypothetical protein
MKSMESAGRYFPGDSGSGFKDDNPDKKLTCEA